MSAAIWSEFQGYLRRAIQHGHDKMLTGHKSRVKTSLAVTTTDLSLTLSLAQSSLYMTVHDGYLYSMVKLYPVRG